MCIRTRVLVLRAVFIGLAMIFSILWLVWMFDMNAYTKFQILWGYMDMTMLRRILAGAVVVCLCGFAATLNFSRKRYCLLVMAVLGAVFGCGLLMSIMLTPETAYYTFKDNTRELIVMEETHSERRQAVFYERKNPAIIEYLGNMDYYGNESVFENGHFDIAWQEDGQVIVRIQAQFANTGNGDAVWNSQGNMETQETKEQVFYVDGQ